MLAVGTGLAKIDWSRLTGYGRSVERDVLTIALHRQLLEIGRKPLEVLIVGQNGDGLSTKEIIVPDGEQPHERWQVSLEGRRTKMFVHLMKTSEHSPEVFRTNGEHRREPDRGVHGVASADPIPKLEH